MNKEEKNVYNNLFEYPTKIIVRLENENEKLQQELKQKNKIIEEIKNNLKNSIKLGEETYKKYKSDNINIYYVSANKVVLDLIEKLEKGDSNEDI